MAESNARSFCERFASDVLVVTSADEFIHTARDATTISFVDNTTIAALDESAAQLGGDDVPAPEWRRLVASFSVGPLFLISDDSARSALAELPRRRWLSHVVGASMLDHPMATAHFEHVIRAATTKGTPRLVDWMGSEVSGRRVQLTHASRRIDRLERMGEYLTTKGATSSAATQLRVAADVLLTNAFYDAPVAAGAVDKSIPYTQDVSLPEESACDLAYGFRDDVVFVRVRDPFGSLSRARVLDVLSRSAHTGQGDAKPPHGLSLVFSVASFVAVSVVTNHVTEVLVGIVDGDRAASRPFAFHLLFKDGAKRRFWKSAAQDTAVSEPSMNTFVSIVLKE
jgi:hypothetical protein